MPKHPSTTVLKDWRGLSNKFPSDRIPENFLEILENFDVDSGGGLSLRQGYTQLIAGTSAHSLWSNGDREAFYADDKILYRINPDNPSTRTQVANLLQPSRLDYYTVGSRTYYSNGTDSGVIENETARPWGIVRPANLPLLSITTGGLSAGTYQVATRYYASDGRVSGSGTAVSITIPDNSGIHVFGLGASSDNTVAGHEVYCTTPNGNTLYQVGDTSTSTFDVTDLHGAMVALENQFIQPCPGGSLVELYNGRLYLANGKYLYYSEPHNFEMFGSKNYIEYPEDITNIMPVDDGIYITADRLYFMEGTSPSHFRQREREIYRAAKYTAVKIIGGDILMENIPTGMKWLFTSDKGIVMVGTGGMVFNLTDRNVFIDSAEEGAAIFRSDEGMNQYMSILQAPQNQRLHVGDTVTANIIRNGVLIT